MSSLPETVPESQKRRLVIAIDYGTTYTGIAYAIPAGNKAHLHEILVADHWGSQMDNTDKVPSVISYSAATTAGEQQWGSSLSPEAVAMVHTKLELDVHDASEELELILGALDGMKDLNFGYVTAAGSLPQYTWKGPETIVQDYLIRVFHALLKESRDRLPEELRYQTPTDIVVTVPADWSYRAKNSTFRALTRAGFNNITFPQLKDMLLVSEPEAAAIYTARYLKDSHGADFLKMDECFALCDAGGGTVDVVSYRVEDLHPNFRIGGVTLATGNRCGSIFIDMEFKKWLRGLIGPYEYERLDPDELAHKISSHYTEGKQMRQLMGDFGKLKRKFNKDHREMKMDLPDPLHNLTQGDRVVGGEITITNAAMKSFFAPCIGRIIDLIEGQIGQVERLGTRLKNIFLVGGFAESKYLQEEIEYSLRLRNIQLRIPDTSWTAVVRGAVIVGIEKSTGRPLSTMKACPRSYGVSVSEYFSGARHNTQDYFIDPITGAPMAKEQLKWLIKKGDLILSNELKVVNQMFTKIFPEKGTREGQISIYSYPDDNIPGRFENAQNELDLVHELEYNLTNIPLQDFIRQQPPKNKPPFYVATLKLTLTLGPRLLRAELSWKDRILNTKDIIYN